MAKDLRDLEGYPYCGHGTVLGKQNNQWQDRDSVLAQFGKSETQAIEGYRRYVAEVRRWGDGPSWWEARVGGGTENGR